MRLDIMIVLLILMFIGYVIMSYKKLIHQHHALEDLTKSIEEQKEMSENTDRLRREYNAMTRAYNHTLDGFVGKLLGQKLKYAKKDMIEKI